MLNGAIAETVHEPSNPLSPSEDIATVVVPRGWILVSSSTYVDGVGLETVVIPVGMEFGLRLLDGVRLRVVVVCL